MADGRTQIEIELIALTKQATQEVKKFSDQTNKQLSTISMASAFSAIKDGFDVASTAFGKVEAFYNKAVGEALATEKAVRSLNNTMRINGEFSEFASQRAREFAENLQRITEGGTSTVLAALKLAGSFGLANKEARNLVTVAADLAAFLQTDLNDATRILGNTMAGVVDRDLKKMIPELEKFTKSQLRAGAAVDFLGQKLKGSAADAMQGLDGDMRRAKKTVDDFAESIGGKLLRVTAFLIRDSEALARNFTAWMAAIKRDSTIGPTIFENTSAAIKRFRQAQEEDAKEQAAAQRAQAKRRAEEAAAEAKERLEQFKASFVEKRRELELASLSEVARINREFMDREAEVKKAHSLGLIKTKIEEQNLIGALEIQRIKKVEDAERRARAEFENATKFSLSEIERINREFLEREKIIRKGFKEGLIAEEREKQRILEGLERERLKAIKEANEQQLAKLSSENAKFANDTANAISDAFRKGEKITRDQAFAAGAGIVANVLKGAEGARQALGAIAGAVANYFIPGIGPVVNEIVQGLSKGPEYVKTMMRDFRQAVPGLVENILTSIPAIFEELIEDTPKIIEKIIQMIPRVVEAFIKAIPQIVVGFIRSIPLIIRTLVVELVKAMPQIIKAFAEGLVEAAKQFVQVLIDEIKSLGGLFGNNGILGSGDGGGGIGGVIGDITGGIGDFFDSINPFATGGRVPDRPVYKGDRYLARLDAGEQVLGGDLSKMLEEFLRGEKGGAGGRTLVHNTYVGGKKVGEAVYDADRRGFRLRYAR